MRKTLEELLGKGNKIHGEIVYTKSHVIKLLELVRLNTIKECAKYAKADYNIINTSERAVLFKEDNIEACILKESILTLDKNSIEL